MPSKRLMLYIVALLLAASLAACGQRLTNIASSKPPPHNFWGYRGRTAHPTGEHRNASTNKRANLCQCSRGQLIRFGAKFPAKSA